MNKFIVIISGEGDSSVEFFESEKSLENSCQIILEKIGFVVKDEDYKDVEELDVEIGEFGITGSYVSWRDEESTFDIQLVKEVEFIEI